MEKPRLDKIPRTNEPIVRVNGWSVKVSALYHAVIVTGILVSFIGSWYRLNYNQEVMLSRISDLKTAFEDQQNEQNQVVKELRDKAEQGAEQRAEMRAQIQNLTLLVGDLRKLIDTNRGG